jgi:hypothetical protein
MTIGTCPLSRSLLGVKRTWPFALHMSAFDPKRTSEPRLAPSSSAELLGSPQAADHRDADQIVIGSLWIGDDIAQTSAKLVGVL